MSKIAHEAGALVVVDNVFATPMLQRPLQHGADIVVYSATKHIDGQGRCLGGAVLGSKDFVTNHLQDFLRQTGPSLSPFNAWVMLKGLETMPVRVKAQTATAAQHRRPPRRTSRASARVLYCGRPDHPQADIAKPADDGRRPDASLSRSTAAKPAPSASRTRCG